MLVRFTRNEMEAVKRIMETIDPEIKMQMNSAIEGPVKINFDGTFTIKIDPDYIVENLEIVAKYLPVVKAICQQIEAVGKDIVNDTERINKKYFPPQQGSSSYEQDLVKAKRDIECKQQQLQHEIEKFNKKFNYKEVE